MAIQKWFVLPTITSDSQFLDVSDTAPLAGNMSTGWRIATSSGSAAPGESSNMRPLTANLVDTFSLTDKPLVPDNAIPNAIRSPMLNGVLPAGIWTLSMFLNALTTGSGCNSRMRYRVYKSKSPTYNGLDNPILQGTTITSNTLGSIAVDVPELTTCSWNAPELKLYDEYLFFTAAFETVTKPTANATRNVRFYAGTSSYIESTNMRSHSFEMVGAIGI